MTDDQSTTDAILDDLWDGFEAGKGLAKQRARASHAVFFACQSCENLRDLTIGTSSRQGRDDMVAQIASAITILNELQTKLMGWGAGR
jgi:hypothetical protein